MKLVAENLSVGYNGKTVFAEINFSAGEGAMIALLGLNGIGKSTLLRTVCGLQKKLSGCISFKGKNIETLTVNERAKIISIVLTEKITVDHLSVRNIISLGRAPYTNLLGTMTAEDEAEVQKIISLMHLEKLALKFFHQISDGEKQKVMIARALCQQTSVIILDEPTAFLDYKNKREILELLKHISKELKKIIILSTHDIETALHYCNKCWLMTEQKIFLEIKDSGNLKEEVFSKLNIPSSGN